MCIYNYTAIICSENSKRCFRIAARNRNEADWVFRKYRDLGNIEFNTNETYFIKTGSYNINNGMIDKVTGKEKTSMISVVDYYNQQTDYLKSCGYEYDVCKDELMERRWRSEYKSIN